MRKQRVFSLKPKNGGQVSSQNMSLSGWFCYGVCLSIFGPDQRQYPDGRSLKGALRSGNLSSKPLDVE
jgi:hypothetical protein